MISDLQTFMAGLIAAHPKFVAAGLQIDNSVAQLAASSAGQNVPASMRGIVLEDGTFPKTPGLEDALAKLGLAIVVWFPDSAGLLDTSKSGVSNMVLCLCVVIIENVAVNRAQGGTGINAQDAYEYVYQSLAGKKRDGDPINTQITPHHEPFANFGTINGVWTVVGNFLKQHRIPL